jgi:hypothetical protein
MTAAPTVSAIAMSSVMGRLMLALLSASLLEPGDPSPIWHHRQESEPISGLTHPQYSWLASPSEQRSQFRAHQAEFYSATDCQHMSRTAYSRG